MRRMVSQLARVRSLGAKARGLTAWAAALVLISLGLPASGRELVKHPRVIEREGFLRQSAEAHLRSRFPSQPFQVEVAVEPVLHDEWDDSRRSLHQLMSRVTRVGIELTLPDG